MTVAEVHMYGTLIGVVTLQDNEKYAEFEYAPSFVESGIELSPIMMPLKKGRVYQFQTLALESFFGLPGMIADSLPDSFGQAIIETWLSQQGRDISSFNAVERLCYTGKRGMGALEYVPAMGEANEDSQTLYLDSLVKLASEIMTNRENISIKYKDSEFIDKDTFSHIMQIGTSAGGARAKAIIAWNKETHEIKSGQIDAGEGFKYYIIKFDGIENNRDKEDLDGEGFTNIEYAYYLMAKDAGIEMSDCELLHDGNLNHFLTRRFDRTENGGKIHMQTLAGLAHYDFKKDGINSYEQVFRIMRKLRIGVAEQNQFFARMVFNIFAMNHDDHVKNISFLMDRNGTWSLSPAYDMTFSYNPNGRWTSKHQMMINGKRDKINLTDILACAYNNNIKESVAIKIINTIKESVSRWEEYADRAAVKDERKIIINTFLQNNIKEVERTVESKVNELEH